MRRKDRELTDIGEIRSILEKCKVCHLAMCDGGAPYVVPLSFGYKLEGEELTLYFHSAMAGHKIDILRKNPEVCFEMSVEGKLGLFENPCNSGYYYESIIGFGRASFVGDDAEKCAALSLIMRRQADRNDVFTKREADTVCVFKVVSDDFRGKRKPEPKAQGN